MAAPDLATATRAGLVLIGCGKMGGALLDGWLSRGVPPGSVWVRDPVADPALAVRGVRVNEDTPDAPAVLLLAVKPQLMAEVLPTLAVGSQTLVISIAAGTRLATLEAALPGAAIVRAMPNTPAAIGQGITAIVGNAHAGAAQMDLAQALLEAVGRVVRLEGEAQMDAVTGLSGSGPAYVFHLIEAMTEAGVAQGLPAALAGELARATVAGAGALAMASDTPPAQLREAVTSKGGTTAAGLAVLMDEAAGLRPLLARTVAAATARGRELGG